jgi:hypothetical protein
MSEEVENLKKQIAELQEQADFLAALEACGVDSWEGYEQAQEMVS